MSCYDLETLRRECQAGKEHRFVFFWRPIPEEDGSLPWRGSPTAAPNST